MITRLSLAKTARLISISKFRYYQTKSFKRSFPIFFAM